MTVDNWHERAVEHLRKALDAVEGEESYTIDAALGNVEEAFLCLAIDAGLMGPLTLKPVEYVEWINEPDPECICPPGLVERGGFKGGCPVHG